MNWELYFSSIKTEADFKLLLSTGMAWELFPDLPDNWKEHEKLYAEWRDGCWATK